MTKVYEYSVHNIVESLVSTSKQRWYEGGGRLPDLGEAYTLRQQLEREKGMQAWLSQLASEVQRAPDHAAHPDAKAAAQERLVQLFIEIAKAALGLQDRHFDYLIEQGLREVTAEFTQQAERFDPTLSSADIYQAYRNASSMHLMQLLFGLPVEVTPAILGFSLLYPYTDNYLDDPQVSPEAKRRFNNWFTWRIAGEDVRPGNEHEERISDLIGLIESQFARRDYPQVYESLLEIQEAQVKSVELLGKDVSPYEVDVLSICFEKGGAAALADGYLVKGWLTPQERDFTFLYGAYTQLVDDLEDVHSDLKSGIQTVFSQTARRWPLDGVTNQLFHFGEYAMDALRGFDQPGVQPLVEMMEISFTPMLVDSASLARFYYTPAYMRRLQSYFPFRFSFIRKQRKRFGQHQDSLKLMLEALMMHTLVQRQ